jgi:uncharacterized membrane protein YGL010W
MTSGDLRNADFLLQDYAQYHRTKGNILCHFFGIWMIVYGILAFLLLVPIVSISRFQLTAAELLIALSVAYYVVLDPRLALSMLVTVSILDFAARAANSPMLALILFVAGWIFQAIGHAVFEKNSPAFLKNLVHLMIGPIFLLNEILHIRRYSIPIA